MKLVATIFASAGAQAVATTKPAQRLGYWVLEPAGRPPAVNQPTAGGPWRSSSVP